MITDRALIYRIQLMYDNVAPAVIHIATKNKERLPELIERNKLWFEKKSKITKWKFLEEILTYEFDEEVYEQYISDCEIVDELE